jgi:protein disulfide-isomerase A6
MPFFRERRDFLVLFERSIAEEEIAKQFATERRQFQIFRIGQKRTGRDQILPFLIYFPIFQMFQLKLAAFLALSLTLEVSALYSKSSGVVDLNANNFDSRVKDSDGVWIVEFYAPWCGHCKQLVPEYQKAAKALKGIIGVGGINCDEEKQLCGQYGVKGFPTIKVFGSNKNKPEDYQGGRDAAGIVQGAQKAAQKVVAERMGGKSSSGGGGGSSGGSGTDNIFDFKTQKP